MRVLFAAAALTGAAQAFWGTAHLLIANRAEYLLSQEAPDALAAANAVLAPLKQDYPELIEEGDHSFTECATFADNIKSKGYTWQSGWHFINLPYFDEGGDASDYPEFVQPDEDIVQALDSLTKFLKGDSSADSTPYITQIKKSFSKEEDQKSFALRLVIHYAGDIHQPLHDAAEVDHTYPKGDRGGNEEHIKSIDGVSNMHSVWDSVIYTYTGFPKTPLSSSDWDWYVSESASLGNQYPVSTKDIKAGDFVAWSEESIAVAPLVYGTFSDPVTEAYKAVAIPALEARMMLGGTRLSKIIEDIYGNKEAHAIATLLSTVLQ